MISTVVVKQKRKQQRERIICAVATGAFANPGTWFGKSPDYYAEIIIKHADAILKKMNEDKE